MATKLFQKGQSGNPKGRPKQDPQLIHARKLNKENVERAISKYLKMSHDQLKQAQVKPEISGLELGIVRVLLRSFKDGDERKLNFLLDRLIGKVKDKVEYTTPEPVIIEMAKGEQIYMNSHPPDEEGEDYE